MEKIVCFIFALFHVAFSQLSLPTVVSPFRWSGTISRDTCTVGETLSIRLQCAIGKDHYLYKSKTSVRASAPQEIILGRPSYSSAVRHHDQVTGRDEEVFVDSVIAVFPMTVAASGSDTVAITVFCSYQGCLRTMCFLPATDSLRLLLTVRPGSAAQNALSAKTAGAPIPSDRERGMSGIPSREGVLPFVLTVLMAFLGGLLTCLTPCVYPLIPVTIGIFGATAAQSRFQAFRLSCTYVGGIVVMFSSLGFVFATTGRVFGQFMANPWVVGFICIIFFIFGLSLLGAFDFQLPSSFQNKLAAFQGRSRGYPKVFFMGLVAGIIAAPCTGPSLGFILTYVAAKANGWQGIILLASFSLGLGLPFLLVGTFSGLLAMRPKPGKWMEGVKSLLACVMFVMALYFIGNALPSTNNYVPSTLPFFILMAVCIGAGLLLGALHLSYHGASVLTFLRKTIGILLVTCGSFGVVAPLSLGARHHDTGEWLTDIDKGVGRGRDLKKPVIIDFYADWCVACKELDKKTFSDASVQRELSRFVRVKADFTKDTPENNRIAKAFSIRGLPVLEFYSSNGERLMEKRLVGFVNGTVLLGHLQTIQ